MRGSSMSSDKSGMCCQILLCHLSGLFVEAKLVPIEILRSEPFSLTIHTYSKRKQNMSKVIIMVLDKLNPFPIY